MGAMKVVPEIAPGGMKRSTVDLNANKCEEIKSLL